MTVADMRRLYDYGSWANERLFAVVSRLPSEQFTQQIAGSYGSIRNTLVHVLSAEWGWLERCGGPPRGERLAPATFPTADSVLTVWRRVQEWMRAFLDDLADADLAREVEFVLGNGPVQSLPLGDLLQHAVIHAVHHRGQVAVLLRTIGWTPGNFDLLIFAGERARAASPAHTESAA